MKVFHKIASICLLLLIATESFGISHYVHFCGDEITSESYFIEHKECCCDGKEETTTMSDCCKDEVKTIVHTSNEAIPVLKSTDVPIINFVSVFYVNSLVLKSDKIITSLFIDDSSNHHFTEGSPPIRQLICSYLI